jgi:hypothetical protein
MTQITNLSTTLAASVDQVDTGINQIQTALATGKTQLNPASQGESTRLSSQVSQYQATASSLGQVQNVINVGQTGLTSAVSLVQQMQSLANQVSSGTLSQTDMAALNLTFQQLAGQIANIGVNSNVNGQNLLISTAGFSVLSGITTASLITVTGTDLTSIGNTLTGLNVSSIPGAYSAVTVLASQLSLISAGQSNLSAAATGITAYTATANSLASGLQQVVDSISNIDPTKLQAQLQQLNNQQSVDYYLVTQMNQEAAAVLTIFR